MDKISRRTILAAAAGSGLTLAGYAAEKPIKLVLSNWLASTSPASVGAFDPWAKLVEEETKGRVVVELHHGGVLGGSKSALDDVRGGVMGVVMSPPVYYYDTVYFKLLIGELPFALPPGSEAGTPVMTDYTNQYCADIFEQLKIKNVGVFATDPYLILSRKPIRSIDDLKGLRLRALGKTWVQLYKDWGAIGVPIQPEDAYTALDRGTIDATYYSTSGSIGWKYFEVAPYVTVMETPSVVINIAMNPAFFARLPPDLQELFVEKLNPQFIALFAKTYQNSAAKALEEMAAYFKSKGKGEVIHLAPEERARFVASSKSAWTDWVAEANRRGYKGDDLMKGFVGILEKHGFKAPF